jgi:DNA-binding transcriptional regulator YdaS (Cro superfamily)
MTMADLSRLIGVQKSTVTRWAKKKIPDVRAVEIEGVTGIPRHKLRPDIFPAPQEVKP